MNKSLLVTCFIWQSK